ncbi:MAG: DUF4157 domain-containing protein [Gammaproteobacteria bacterium]|nr:DUF4157 domain-containing protein [Gammaproteobacteria bacterium]
MEPRIGADFSGVRVHASTPSARALGSPRDAQERDADRVANASSFAASTTEKSVADLSAVRVHTDPLAAQSAQVLGARAYTLGNHIVFASGQYAPASSSGQRMLLHELAHVAQQSRTGDATVRCFTEFSVHEQTTSQSDGWKHPNSAKLRIADDGQLAAENRGWGAGLSKRAWTVPAKLPASNKTLADQGSIAQLRLKSGGQDISGKSPDTGQTTTLQEVEPMKRNAAPGDSDYRTAGGVVGGITGGIGAGVGLGYAGAKIGESLASSSNSKGGLIAGAIIGGVLGAVGGAIGGAYAGSAIGKQVKRTPSFDLELASDCGTACRQVTGSGMAGKRDVGVIKGQGGADEYLTPRTYHGGDPTTPEQWSEELFKKEFGANLTRQEAYARYAALSSADKDAFDRKYGINKYAVPHVGQGITESTEKDMPGFSSSGFTWNFHYAATVLESGHDYITLENAAGWDPTDWIFFMYGPAAKQQSFHEFQSGTGTHGSKSSAMVVQPQP